MERTHEGGEHAGAEGTGDALQQLQLLATLQQYPGRCSSAHGAAGPAGIVQGCRQGMAVQHLYLPATLQHLRGHLSAHGFQPAGDASGRGVASSAFRLPPHVSTCISRRAMHQVRARRSTPAGWGSLKFCRLRRHIEVHAAGSGRRQLEQQQHTVRYISDHCWQRFAG